MSPPRAASPTPDTPTNQESEDENVTFETVPLSSMLYPYRIKVELYNKKAQPIVCAVGCNSTIMAERVADEILYGNSNSTLFATETLKIHRLILEVLRPETVIFEVESWGPDEEPDVFLSGEYAEVRVLFPAQS
jgi:hypothetical protein